MEALEKIEIVTTNSREQWESMEGMEQLKILKSMAWKAKKSAGERGYMWEAIFTEPDALDMIASESWIILTEALKNRHTHKLPLAILAYRAAAAAAQRIYNHERKHTSTLMWDEEAAELIFSAGRRSTAGTPTPSPEEHAEAMEAIEEAAHDATDRVIIQMIIAGYTQKEIAARLAITPAAINKRVKAIQERGNRYNEI